MKSQQTAFLVFDILEAVVTMYLDARSFSYLHILLIGTYSQNACVRAKSMYWWANKKKKSISIEVGSLQPSNSRNRSHINSHPSTKNTVRLHRTHPITKALQQSRSAVLGTSPVTCGASSLLVSLPASGTYLKLNMLASPSPSPCSGPLVNKLVGQEVAHAE